MGLSFPDHLNEELSEEIHQLCEVVWKGNGLSYGFKQKFLGRIKDLFVEKVN